MILGAAGRIPGDWRHITEDLLRQVAREGYGSLNIVVSDPVDVSIEDVSNLRTMFDETGMTIGQTNGAYGGDLVSGDSSLRRAAVEFVKRMCELTRRLDAPNTYLRPGSMNPAGPWQPHPENRSHAVFDRLVDSSQLICAVAEDEGVVVAVEGGAVSPLYSAQRVHDFIDAVGSAALGFNQDPVNFVGSLEDTYDTQSFLRGFFDLLGDRTVGAHAKDFTVIDQLMVRFEEAEIGCGLLDHRLYLEEMQRVCPSAHVLIEHLPPDRYADAAVAYRRYGAEAGIEWDNVEVHDGGKS